MAGFLDLTGLSRFKSKLLEAVYEINEFRRKSTAYAVGDKVDCAFQYERFLECTKAGTTSADLLDTRSVTHGQVIADGTVEWTVRTHVRSINGGVANENGNVQITAGVTHEEIIEASSNALETVTNATGTTDLAAVMSAVAALQADLNQYKTMLDSIKAYVVEKGTTASGWYRRYSDGWIEQGGYFDPTSTTMTISLKEMANTDYVILLTDAHTSSIQGSGAVSTVNKKTTSFECKCNTGIAGDMYWRVSGFAKVV